MPYSQISPLNRGFIQFLPVAPGPDGSMVYNHLPVDNSQTALASFVAPSNGTFWVNVVSSTEEEYDFAFGYVRDYSSGNAVKVKDVFTQSGLSNQQYLVAVPAGYALDIEYVRDSSDGGGDNQVMIAVGFDSSVFPSDFPQVANIPDNTNYLPFEVGAFAPDGSTGFRAANFTDDNQGAQISFLAPFSGTAVIQWRFDTTNASRYGFSAYLPHNYSNIDAVANVGWASVEVEIAYNQEIQFTFYSNGYIYPPWEGNSVQLSIHMKSVSSGPQTIPLYLSADSVVSLALSAANLAGVLVPLHIGGAGAIAIVGEHGHLMFIRSLQGIGVLSILGQHRTAHAPPGLNALMKVVKDPVQKDVVLDQYLDLWFFGDPTSCQISLTVDDSADLSPEWTWSNPGEYAPAIVRIDSAAIPDDARTHRLSVAVWQSVGGQSGPKATISLLAKTSSSRTAESPEWCGGELVRQATADLGELSKVSWRHDGAVQLVAKYRLWNPGYPQSFTEKVVSLGFGAHDQSSSLVEDVSVKIGWSGGETRPVTFGVSALHNGQFGPVTWAVQPLMVVGRRRPEDTAETTPDQATRRNITEDGLITDVLADLRAVLASPPDNLSSVVIKSQQKLLARIKLIVSKGGSVELANLGTFSASWNKDQTSRGVTFSPSAGFKVGTRLGRVLTDLEAKTP